jgi:hypothetical protein
MYEICYLVAQVPVIFDKTAVHFGDVRVDEHWVVKPLLAESDRGKKRK